MSVPSPTPGVSVWDARWDDDQQALAVAYAETQMHEASQHASAALAALKAACDWYTTTLVFNARR